MSPLRRTLEIVIIVRRALPWVLRLLWVVVLVVGGPALDNAVGRNDQASLITWLAFAGWALAVVAMAVPSVVALTATRLLVPVAIPASALVLAAGGGAAGWGLIAVSILATLACGAAELGRSFVQASAYGEEDRHLLRPPVAYLLAAVVAWLVWAAAVVAAVPLLADGRWWIGVPAALVAVIGAIGGWPRWHRLSRRWFVVVPIGIVVHDHLVLAETVMIRRQEIASMHLAPTGTEAADLTGPASGHALEIVTHEPTTVIFAATPREPRGKAIHLTAALVAPSRPGQALVSAAGRGLPVG